MKSPSRVRLADRSQLDRLEVTGADRIRFLNGQVTCDLKPLVPGTGTYGFFCSNKGRVEADVVVLMLEDRLWLELPTGLGGSMRERLLRYRIVDRVEVEPLANLMDYCFLGEGAGADLGQAVAEIGAAPWSHATGSIAGSHGRLIRRPGMGAEAFSFWSEATKGAFEVFEAIAADELEAIRLAAGVPIFGLDFGPDCLPQETGLEGAVSYTKGCYLGQEVIARLHYRGKVARQLRRLRFEKAAPPAGAELLYEDRPAGVVTSRSDRTPFGLGMIQRRAFGSGTRLDVAGAGTAIVEGEVSAGLAVAG